MQQNIADKSVTPMMQQYFATKAEYQDCLLFYRMGDFYELFFDDVQVAAQVLDIALTHRGKHCGEDIPMCGVPERAYEPYLHKLIQAGHRVAVCEQMEKPEEAKKRGYKAVVRREVVRIITPGTIIEDSLLDARNANYLAALVRLGKDLALAWIDISTGEFYTSVTSDNALATDLSRLSPKEILIADQLFVDDKLSPILREHRQALTPHSANIFEYLRAESRLKEFYGVNEIAGFGDLSRAEISACGSLLEYIEVTQKGNMPRLAVPKQFQSNNFMIIDAATRRNLELTSTLQGGKKGSLLSVIDKTITAGGARLLSSYIASPLTDVAAIDNRLNLLQFFYENDEVRANIREALKIVPDMERALSRLCMDKGTPRDLAAIRVGLQSVVVIAENLEFCGIELPSSLVVLLRHAGNHDKLISLLNEALEDEITGGLPRDGGYIASGYHSKLDEMRLLRDNSQDEILKLRQRYRDETSIPTLKIVRNNVLGFFVEVTPSYSDKIVDDKFIHRQTLASAVRYTTEELRALENEILNAKDHALRLEVELFEQLCDAVIKSSEEIYMAAQVLSGIDVASALAEVAQEYGYIRPEINDSLNFSIKNGRHPVVEKSLEVGGFIKNSANFMKDQKLWLLTGPNMAGKSTFLRQNALIAIMAQIGSYVPADAANIGVVDKIFSRVGASDDLARGRSTFMVEMVETAVILNNATQKSLVILDEIGRGTSTHDGLSIAWAVVEYLHNIVRCRGLFATHYHELTSLKAQLPSLACYTMKVKEWQGKVIFLHEVIEGTADRSYGIHVASLAGLPGKVIQRAGEVLSVLQETDLVSDNDKLSGGLPLFSLQSHDGQNKEEQFASNDNLNGKFVSEGEFKTLQALLDLNIDEMSPKDAIDFLYKVKSG